MSTPYLLIIATLGFAVVALQSRMFFAASQVGTACLPDDSMFAVGETRRIGWKRSGFRRLRVTNAVWSGVLKYSLSPVCSTKRNVFGVGHHMLCLIFHK